MKRKTGDQLNFVVGRMVTFLWQPRSIEGSPQVCEDEDSRRERERRERGEAAIREREKAVKEALTSSLRERDKEREVHLHEEAVQNFKVRRSALWTVGHSLTLKF